MNTSKFKNYEFTDQLPDESDRDWAIRNNVLACCPNQIKADIREVKNITREVIEGGQILGFGKRVE